MHPKYGTVVAAGDVKEEHAKEDEIAIFKSPHPPHPNQNQLSQRQICCDLVLKKGAVGGEGRRAKRCLSSSGLHGRKNQDFASLKAAQGPCRLEGRPSKHWSVSGNTDEKYRTPKISQNYEFDYLKMASIGRAVPTSWQFQPI